MSQEKPPEKPGLAARLRNAVAKASDTVGEVAGKLASTAGQAAESTGRRAKLTFRGGTKQELPLWNLENLRTQLQAWLMLQSFQLPPAPDDQTLAFQEAGLLGRQCFFLFAEEADETSTARLQHWHSQGYGAVLLARRWPPQRCDLPAEAAVLIWEDQVRLGPRGGSSDYLCDWILQTWGFQFDALQLSAKPTRAGQRTPPSALMAREEPLELLASGLGQPRRPPHDPWIYSLTGVGGVGKTFLLKHLSERMGQRVLLAQLDHQLCESSRQGLAELMFLLLQSLALNFENAGCSCGQFNKLFLKLAPEPPRSPGERDSSLPGGLRSLLDLAKSKNVLLSAADAGWQLYEAYSKEVREEGEAIAADTRIRRLTSALVADLAAFCEGQRKRYYLWRRPVLVLDSYEWLALVLDTWLRTVLLVDHEFLQLQPVILIAARQDLMRLNSRWSEYQHQIRNLRLESFQAHEADQYLQKLGIQDPQRRQESWELTLGSPLFLSLAAHSSSQEMAVKTVAERILEEVDPKFRQAFLDASVPDGFNRDSLRSILGEHSDAAFEALSRATFVSAEGGSWRYEASVRNALRRCLALESPRRYQDLTLLVEVAPQDDREVARHRKGREKSQNVAKPKEKTQ